jgi:stage III sporulation protein AG
MELSKLKTNFNPGAFIKKYKYLLLVIAAGVVLMLWPGDDGKKDAASSSAADFSTQAGSTQELEKKLGDALSKIDGAGKTTVVLTLKSDWQTVIAQNTEKESSSQKTGDSSSVEEKESASAVTVDGDNGDQVVVLERIYPKYQGALVVCQGADDVKVRTEVLNAVSRLTGLGTDKITVSKMKSD